METKTTWDDTGRDCPFCGGQILRRTDEEPTRITAYYQCQRCGAQWTLGNKLMRESNLPVAEKEGGLAETLRDVPRWVWLLLGVALLVLVLRLSVIGVLLMRFIVPVAFLTVVLVVGYFYGKWMHWWGG
jgi:hypothetical protein